MPFNPKTDALSGPARLVVYPMIVQGAPIYFLAYEVRFRTLEAHGLGTLLRQPAFEFAVMRANEAARAVHLVVRAGHSTSDPSRLVAEQSSNMQARDGASSRNEGFDPRSALLVSGATVIHGRRERRRPVVPVPHGLGAPCTDAGAAVAVEAPL